MVGWIWKYLVHLEDPEITYPITIEAALPWSSQEIRVKALGLSYPEQVLGILVTLV